MPDPDSSLEQETQQRDSPPSNSSSPGSTEQSTDTKLSRKREREASLELATTPKATVDVDPLSRETKETRTPAKKNRVYLDPTEEEEDMGSRSRSNSDSPPQSVSPPQEMKIKVRQISQGVEDLSWRNMKATTPERDHGVDSVTTLPTTVEVENESIVPNAMSEATVQGQTVDSLDVFEPDNGEKGLKRKFLERGTSQGPPDMEDAIRSLPEPVKRPRDDADKDDNPREAKRPSPPPEPKSPKRTSAQAASSKLTGFMAYASTSSPFAAVKGQNIFSSNKSSPSPPVSISPTPMTSTPSSFSASASTSFSQQSALPPTKRSGFEAFASPTSPFTPAARSKSPVLGSASKLGRAKSPRRANSSNSNAFSPYASGVQSFAIPTQKRARAGSPSSSSRSSLERNGNLRTFGGDGAALDSGTEDDKNVSFSAKLRAGKDNEDEGKSDDEQAKPILAEQDITTGEEEEDTVHQVRGKLFSLSDGNQWKERGSGTLKLNVRRSDGSGARLVMRKEAVYALLLNVTLFNGMRCSLAQDPRYLRFSVIEDGVTTHYNLRLASAKIAQELLEEINANIPTL